MYWKKEHFAAGTGLLVMAAFLLVGGCRTANQHRVAADKAAARIIEQYQQKALGTNEPFSIERPSVLLRKRLMIEQGLPVATNELSAPVEELIPGMPDPLKLSLMDSLRVGARNSRRYQQAKEVVFKTALSLDLERDKFRNSYAGLVSSMFSSSDSDGEKAESVEYGASAGVTRKLQSGATLSTKLAVDLVKLLTEAGGRGTWFV